MLTADPREARPHRNHGLFSDHYLDTALPESEEWRSLLGEAEKVLEELRGIFEDYGPKAGEKEAQTEHAWVRPVLKALGHDAFEVQPSLKVPGSIQTPDYVLYPSPAARDAAGGKALDEDVLRSLGAYAVVDAKRWDRPLDVALKEGKDPFDNRNPSYQISFYMQHSGVEWGILPTAGSGACTIGIPPTSSTASTRWTCRRSSRGTTREASCTSTPSSAGRRSTAGGRPRSGRSSGVASSTP